VAAVSASRLILCINCGSSSLKFALYQLASDEQLVASGEVDRIGIPGTSIKVLDGAGAILREGPFELSRLDEIVGAIFAELEQRQLPRPIAVGHRVVHGGPDHTTPQLVTPEVLTALRKVVPFVPLHLPGAIAAIEAIGARFPELPQVVCFDTAFHRTLPEIAARFPMPRELWDVGVRRYGFHGLSYEYIVSVLGGQSRGRVIIAHLGNGASLAAVRDGRSVDTTMGFTPTGGFMMGTRSGDLDPGLILYLLREKGYDAKQLDEAVNRAAGLLGVSGVSSDMRALKESRDPRAELARQMFGYQLRKQIGAMTAVLEGIDTLVFTGGIGEHDAEIRWEVCRGLRHLGIEIDSQRNAANRDPISAAGSKCTVRVIPTNEDLVIVRHTRAIVGGAETTQGPS
jgi:acetate kinase